MRGPRMTESVLVEHFGSSDPSTLTADLYARGVESLLTAIRTAPREDHRLTLWLAARTIGEAPPAAKTFNDPAIRARATAFEEAGF